MMRIDFRGHRIFHANFLALVHFDSFILSGIYADVAILEILTVKPNRFRWYGQPEAQNGSLLPTCQRLIGIVCL